MIQVFVKNVFNWFEHETKKHVLVRFILLFLVLVFYFLFVSMEYGLEKGLLITIVTWSFFVFCTPVALAGFLLDFPIRLITGVRMFYSELMVWLVAFTINVLTILFAPNIYSKTLFLKIFYQILSQPIPYWSIIFLSATGTFLSIYFADELLDVSTQSKRKEYHKHSLKHQFIISLFIIAIVIFLYNFILKELGINLF